jgi:hypothetical protein
MLKTVLTPLLLLTIKKFYNYLKSYIIVLIAVIQIVLNYGEAHWNPWSYLPFILGLINPFQTGIYAIVLLPFIPQEFIELEIVSIVLLPLSVSISLDTFIDFIYYSLFKNRISKIFFIKPYIIAGKLYWLSYKNIHYNNNQPYIKQWTSTKYTI